jgi:5-deoxy-glucuronate isomerase
MNRSAIRRVATELWSDEDPPHKHHCDAFPDEAFLGGTYYHRLDPSTDDRSLDETCAASDSDVALVPKGYHPVGAPHGYEFYLNVMAGPKRAWKFYNDPDHAWMMNRSASRRDQATGCSSPWFSAAR